MAVKRFITLGLVLYWSYWDYFKVIN